MATVSMSRGNAIAAETTMVQILSQGREPSTDPKERLRLELRLTGLFERLPEDVQNLVRAKAYEIAKAWGLKGTDAPGYDWGRANVVASNMKTPLVQEAMQDVFSRLFPNSAAPRENDLKLLKTAIEKNDKVNSKGLLWKNFCQMTPEMQDELRAKVYHLAKERGGYVTDAPGLDFGREFVTEENMADPLVIKAMEDLKAEIDSVMGVSKGPKQAQERQEQISPRTAGVESGES